MAQVQLPDGTWVDENDLQAVALQGGAGAPDVRQQLNQWLADQTQAASEAAKPESGLDSFLRRLSAGFSRTSHLGPVIGALLGGIRSPQDIARTKVAGLNENIGALNKWLAATDATAKSAEDRAKATANTKATEFNLGEAKKEAIRRDNASWWQRQGAVDKINEQQGQQAQAFRDTLDQITKGGLTYSGVPAGTVPGDRTAPGSARSNSAFSIFANALSGDPTSRAFLEQNAAEKAAKIVAGGGALDEVGSVHAKDVVSGAPVVFPWTRPALPDVTNAAEVQATAARIGLKTAGGKAAPAPSKYKTRAVGPDGSLVVDVEPEAANAPPARSGVSDLEQAARKLEADQRSQETQQRALGLNSKLAGKETLLRAWEKAAATMIADKTGRFGPDSLRASDKNLAKLRAEIADLKAQLEQ